jgi:Tfp pilus assembly protein PilF
MNSGTSELFVKAIEAQRTGNNHAAKGNDADALSYYQQALDIDPNFADAWANRGMAEARLGLNYLAQTSFIRAAELMQEHPEALNTIGNQLFSLLAFDRASMCYIWATKVDPTFTNAWNNLGNTYLQLLKLEDAIKAYEQAITINPAHADAKNGYAQALLMNGNFDPGWTAYEARFDKPDAPPRRKYLSPEWMGQNLKGKSILLYAEQGIGDTIQFMRFSKHLKDMGAHILIECQESLIELVTAHPSIDQAIPLNDPTPSTDYHAPLMSLPYLLKLNVTASLAAAPYIEISPSRKQKSEKLSIGLVWGGNPDHVNDRNRSIPLVEFSSLFDLPDVDIVSLQFGKARSQIKNTTMLADCGKDFLSFVDLAQAIADLDLLITADTASSHLAGAMGCPCWVLLPFVPDWRWMLHKTDTHWYSSIRLFRQKNRGDWGSVINDVSIALTLYKKK